MSAPSPALEALGKQNPDSLLSSTKEIWNELAIVQPRAFSCGNDQGDAKLDKNCQRGSLYIFGSRGARKAKSGLIAFVNQRDWKRTLVQPLTASFCLRKRTKSYQIGPKNANVDGLYFRRASYSHSRVFSLWQQLRMRRLLRGSQRLLRMLRKFVILTGFSGIPSTFSDS